MNRIPKKLHLYWDGSPMSKLQAQTVTTFSKLNPDWGIFVYMPVQDYSGGHEYIPSYTGEDFFGLVETHPAVTIVRVDMNDYEIDTNLHNILRSDILRYHLLYNYGGVWADFDIVWLKPMSSVSEISVAGKVPAAEMGASLSMFRTTDGHHSIGVMFSAKGHPLYKDVLNAIDDMLANDTVPKFPDGKPRHQAFGSTLLNQLYPNMDAVNSKYDDVVGFKYETFYPFSIFSLETLYRPNSLHLIKPDTLCVHWFNGHELSKAYVNNNYNGACTMTEILKGIGFYNE